MIIAYTDGSSKGNPGPGGWGAVVLESWDGTIEGAVLIDVYAIQSEGITTNNREEMKAILWVMEHYGDENHRGNGFVIPVVYSDSTYCINSFTNWIEGWKWNGWRRVNNKPLENLDLIKKYDKLKQEGYSIHLKKVAGHNGDFWNEVADRLATNSMTPEEVINKYGWN